MSRQPCGTNAAYQHHMQNGEIPCTPCQFAHTRHNVARDIRAGRTQSFRIPHEVLAELYLESTPRAQERLEQQIGVDVVEAIVQRFDREDIAS